MTEIIVNADAGPEADFKKTYVLHNIAYMSFRALSAYLGARGGGGMLLSSSQGI